MEATRFKRVVFAAVVAMGLIAGAGRLRAQEVIEPQHEVVFSVVGYDGASQLFDFPVPVRISEGSILGFKYDNCAPDGSDLQFIQRGEPCPYEIEKWDVTGESIVWVRLSSLVGGARFSMRFGGSETENDPTEVWSGGYHGVWHMAEPTGSVADATGNGHTAVPTGKESVYDTLSVGGEGVVGGGRKNGSADGVKGGESSYLSLSGSENLALNGRFAVSGWIKRAGTGRDYQRVMSSKKVASDTNGFEIHGDQSGESWRVRAKGDGMISPANGWRQGVWMHYAFVYDGDTLSAYQNGVLTLSQEVSGCAALDCENPISIASNSDGSEWAFYGTLDEFRLHDGAVSADWVRAEWESADAGFLDAGPVKSVEKPVAPTHEVVLTVTGYNGEVLQDFPVLVRISEASISGFSYGLCSNSGEDLSFEQAGVPCAYEIEKWDVAGESLVWVRLPTLVGGGNFTMRFGGSNAENDPSEVWSSAVHGGYFGVWHMAEANGSVKDATMHGHPAVPMGSQKDACSVRDESGIVGFGRKNGSAEHVSGANSSYLSLANTANLALNGHFAVSGWMKRAADGFYWPRAVSNKSTGTADLGFEIHGAESSRVWKMRARGSTAVETPIGWEKDVWAHYAFVYDGDTLSIYENGVQKVSSKVDNSSVMDSPDPISIASNTSGSEWALYGSLDEFRLHSGAVSADWVKAECDCVGEGFLVAGEVRGISGEGGRISATLTNVEVFEDGVAYGPTLTVIEPTEGYEVEWSVDGGEYGPERPVFDTAGVHSIVCRISATGYQTRELQSTVKIKLREIDAEATDFSSSYDGQPHGCVVTVRDPAEGYLLEWSTDGETFAATQPTVGYGSTRVYCRISKEHYVAKVVDANVYQRSSGSVYVSRTGTAVVPYDTPETAARALRDAVEMAGDGRKVFVLSGDYPVGNAADALYDGQLTVDRGIEIVGPADRSAVLQGPGWGHEAKLYLRNGSKLSGCTMLDFHTAVCSEANTVVSNCVIRRCTNPVRLGGVLTHCTVTEYGGEDRLTEHGVKIETASTLISHCEISHGHVFSSDINDRPVAAILSYPGGLPIRIEDTVIADTTSISYFCATIFSEGGAPAVLTRCKLIGNVSRAGIARLSHDGAARQPLYATNCLFAANKSISVKPWLPSASETKFGAIFAWGEVVNCTFVGNDAEQLFRLNSDYFYRQGSMKVVNCVFQDNLIDSYEDIVEGQRDGTMTDVSYSLYPEATGENGNIVGPARFVGNGDDPYRLSTGSPGIGAGTNLNWQQSDVDLRGSRRLCGGKVDMGCYEAGGGLAIMFY